MAEPVLMKGSNAPAVRDLQEALSALGHYHGPIDGAFGDATEAAVKAFRTQCDQAVAKDAAIQAHVRQLEQDYDATGDEAPRPRREDAFNPEQLMHELEEFLRQEREGGAE